LKLLNPKKTEKYAENIQNFKKESETHLRHQLGKITIHQQQAMSMKHRTELCLWGEIPKQGILKSLKPQSKTGFEDRRCPFL